MTINTKNVDLVIQYSLLAAGDEDDPFDRQLGPIHIIKYVYLADLFFAGKNEGQTFTGIQWRFYKFGPWSQEVNSRIEPALNAIHAAMTQFSSDYEDKEDWVRWNLHDDELFERKQRELPAIITMNLKREIHKYGKDTPCLLDRVYKTSPMLAAAPNDILDFSLVVGEKKMADYAGAVPLRFESLSKKKQKTFKERIAAIKTKHLASEASRPKLISPVSEPRYDDVFLQGISWLENLVGDKFDTSQKIVEFSDEVWSSLTRKGNDIS